MSPPDFPALQNLIARRLSLAIYIYSQRNVVSNIAAG